MSNGHPSYPRVDITNELASWAPRQADEAYHMDGVAGPPITFPPPTANWGSTAHIFRYCHVDRRRLNREKRKAKLAARRLGMYCNSPHPPETKQLRQAKRKLRRQFKSAHMANLNALSEHFKVFTVTSPIISDVPVTDMRRLLEENLNRAFPGQNVTVAI